MGSCVAVTVNVPKRSSATTAVDTVVLGRDHSARSSSYIPVSTALPESPLVEGLHTIENRQNCCTNGKHSKKEGEDKGLDP